MIPRFWFSAVVLFVLWLLIHSTVAIANLLWLIILVAVVLWVLGFLRGRRQQGHLADLLLISEAAGRKASRTALPKMFAASTVKRSSPLGR